MDLSYPPFEMQDKAGNPDGVGVRLAEALAANLGRPLKIVPMEFSGLIPALKTGNVDLILSSMTATDERRQSIDFSNPYAFTGLALLVRKDSDIQSIEDLKKPGRTVTAKTATTGETWAIKNLPGAKRVVFEDQTACVHGSRAGPGGCVHLRPAQHLSIRGGEQGDHPRLAEALRRGVVGHRDRQGQ